MFAHASSRTENNADRNTDSLDGDKTASRSSEATVARRYTAAYADGDDETLLSLLDDDCEFGTLDGVVSGTDAVRAALAEERNLGMQFIGATSALSTAPGVSSKGEAFERGGWKRRCVTGWRSYIEEARFVKLRETIIVKDGRVVARVLQKTSKTRSFALGK